MTNDLSILKIASALARHASAQQQAATQNIAQVNTPGYKARDIAPFDIDAALNDPNAFEARVKRGGVASPNGNTVSLSDEMLTASMAHMQHRTALGIYRKSMDLMRISLGRRG